MLLGQAAGSVLLLEVVRAALVSSATAVAVTVAGMLAVVVLSFSFISFACSVWCDHSRESTAGQLSRALGPGAQHAGQWQVGSMMQAPASLCSRSAMLIDSRVIRVHRSWTLSRTLRPLQVGEGAGKAQLERELDRDQRHHLSPAAPRRPPSDCKPPLPGDAPEPNSAAQMLHLLWRPRLAANDVLPRCWQSRLKKDTFAMCRHCGMSMRRRSCRQATRQWLS